MRYLSIAATAVLVSLAACSSSRIVEPSATVNFVLVAPLCSTVIPTEFLVDGRLLGVDTFRVAVSSPHTVSRDFQVTPGEHVFSAQFPNHNVWATNTMTITAGARASDSLPFYCS